MTELLYMYVLHNRIQPCILKMCTIIMCELTPWCSLVPRLGLLPSVFFRDLILEGEKMVESLVFLFIYFFWGGGGSNGLT